MEVQQQIDRAKMMARDEALEMSNRKKKSDRIPLVVNYHPNLPPLSKILREHLPILHVTERMKLTVPNPPLLAN